MRPQKKAKAAPASNSTLAQDFMMQTQMCQNAIKDLKQLMKKSRIEKDSSKVLKKELPSPSNTRNDRPESPPSDNQKGTSHEQSNPSPKMQNGLHCQSEAVMAEPNNLLERLRRISQEVDEFLRTSESFTNRHKRTRRVSSRMDGHQDHHQFCHIDVHLNGQNESSNGLQSIDETHGGKSDKGSVELKACTSDGLNACQEDAKHDKPAEVCQENAKNDEPTEVHQELDEPIIDQALEGDDGESESESESEDDGFKEIWRDAEFSRECLIQDQRVEKSELSATKEECKHKFFLKGDMGLVCDACGLVGKDIESIFNFTWGNDFKRRESNKAGAHEVTICADSSMEKDDILEQQANNEHFMHQSLILHSRYRAEMHEHQIDGFKFLEENIVKEDHGGCILAHAPGTGKTFLTIAFLHSFLQAYPENRVMILAPKGMLHPWVREFRKWKFDLPLLNLHEGSCSSQLAMGFGDNQIPMTDNSARSQHKLNHLQRVREWKTTKSILLVSYPHFSILVNHQTGDAITLEIKRLLLEVPGLVILDEGHIGRNSATIILKCLMDICTKKRIMLSGTLFQNNFEEMYNLLKLVRPNFMREKAERLKGFLKNLLAGQGADCMHSKLFGVKLSGKKHPEEVTEQRIFVNCLCEKIETGEEEEQNEALKLLHELMAPFIHWHKGKVLEGLPGLTDFTIFLNLTAAQESAFVTLKSQVLNTMDREKRSALANVHPLLLKVRPTKQASQSKEDCESNPEKMDQNADAMDGNSLSILSECDPTQGCKAMFVLDVVALCTQLQEKVLVFSQYLSPLTLLQKLFWKLWGWYDNQQVLRLDGEISSESRECIINRFNKDKNSRVLLASIRACGEGVSLVGASRVVFLDMNWNPAVTQQAISRAFRLGQSKKVYAYRLVGIGTLDEEIERAACRKEWLASMISHASLDSHYELRSEVDLQREDRLFESAELRRQVARCYCKALEHHCPVDGLGASI